MTAPHADRQGIPGPNPAHQMERRRLGPSDPCGGGWGVATAPQASLPAGLAVPAASSTTTRTHFSPQPHRVGSDACLIRGNRSHPLLRTAGWSAYASGVLAVIGLVPFGGFFAFGAQAWPIPGLNDRAAIVHYLLALPITLTLHQVVQARAHVPSTVAMSTVAVWLGIVGIVAFAVVQILWLFESIGVTTYYILLGPAMLMTGAWLVITGYYVGRALQRNTSAESPHKHPGDTLLCLSNLGDSGRCGWAVCSFPAKWPELTLP